MHTLAALLVASFAAAANASSSSASSNSSNSNTANNVQFSPNRTIAQNIAQLAARTPYTANNRTYRSILGARPNQTSASASQSSFAMIDAVLRSPCGAGIRQILDAQGTNVTFFMPTDAAFASVPGWSALTPQDFQQACQASGTAAASLTTYPSSSYYNTTSSAGAGASSNNNMAQSCALLFDAAASGQLTDARPLIQCLPYILQYHTAAAPLKLASYGGAASNNASSASSSTSLTLQYPASSASTGSILLRSFLMDPTLAIVPYPNNNAYQSSGSSSSSSSMTSAGASSAASINAVVQQANAYGQVLLVNPQPPSNQQNQSGNSNTQSSGQRPPNSPVAQIDFGYTAPAYITQADLQASNGYAQVVDRLFIPPPPSAQAALSAINETAFLTAIGATQTTPIPASLTSITSASQSSTAGGFGAGAGLGGANAGASASPDTASAGAGFWRNLLRLQATSSDSTGSNASSTAFGLQQLDAAPNITLFVPSNQALSACFGSAVSQSAPGFSLAAFVVTAPPNQQQQQQGATTTSSGSSSSSNASVATTASSSNAYAGYAGVTQTLTNTNTSSSSAGAVSQTLSSSFMPTVVAGQTLTVSTASSTQPQSQQTSGGSTAPFASTQQPLVYVNGIPVLTANVLIKNGVMHVMDGVFPWVSCPASSSSSAAGAGAAAGGRSSSANMTSTR